MVDVKLALNDISVAYGDKLAVRNASLQVAPGEVVALIGPNGAGKTTLLRAASGVLARRSGSVCIDGEELLALTERQRARRLAVVPQARHLPPAFTVRQTVMLGRTAYLGWLGKPQKADEAKVDEALGHTQLAEFGDRRVGELSGGEQQRVLLARALAQDTAILLLDEPTAHLDLQHQAGILSLVKKMAAERNLAVLMSLHDLNLVAMYAQRVVLMVAGQIQASGTPDEVLTMERLSAAYHTPLQVTAHPQHGTPLILPDG